MRTFLIILSFIPTLAFGQGNVIGKFINENKQVRNFFIFRTDFKFEYPSEYSQFKENQIGKYDTKGDTIFLHFPLYKLDTVVGYGKGLFVGLAVDQNSVRLEDTLLLKEHKLYRIIRASNKQDNPKKQRSIKLFMRKVD